MDEVDSGVILAAITLYGGCSRISSRTWGAWQVLPAAHAEHGQLGAIPRLTDSLSAGDAGTFQAFGELAHGFAAGSIRFERFANLAHVSLHTDRFTERGGAAFLGTQPATSPSQRSVSALNTALL